MWGEFFISDKKEKKIFNLIKLHKHTLAFIKISVKLLKCRDRGEWNKGRALTYKIIFNTVYRMSGLWTILFPILRIRQLAGSTNNGIQSGEITIIWAGIPLQGSTGHYWAPLLLILNLLIIYHLAHRYYSHYYRNRI